MEFRIKFTKEFYETIREVRDLFKTSPESVRDAFSTWLTTGLDPAVQSQLSGRSLKRRTGRMASNYEITQAFLVGKDVKAFLIHREPQAFIQETGGVIQARAGSWLTVPLPAAMTGTGALKAPARHWSNTFFQKSRRGNLILFQNKGDSIVPLFVLKRSIRLKATHWFSNAVDASADKLFALIQAELGE